MILVEVISRDLFIGLNNQNHRLSTLVLLGCYFLTNFGGILLSVHHCQFSLPIDDIADSENAKSTMQAASR